MALKMVKVVVIFLLSNPNRVTRILKKLFGNFTREQSGKNGILGEIRSRSHTLLGDYVNNINILFTRDLQPKRGLFHASSFAMTRKDDQKQTPDIATVWRFVPPYHLDAWNRTLQIATKAFEPFSLLREIFLQIASNLKSHSFSSQLRVIECWRR